MLARVRRLKVAKWRYFDGVCRPFGARRDAAKVKGTVQEDGCTRTGCSPTSLALAKEVVPRSFPVRHDERPTLYTVLYLDYTEL
jgi:hypothetical protein